jgi:hypothetical protein
MTAMPMTMPDLFKMEACFPARRDVRPQHGDAKSAREYCLQDPAGRPIGTIAAPADQPRFGAGAPTLLLRRKA